MHRPSKQSAIEHRKKKKNRKSGNRKPTPDLKSEIRKSGNYACVALRNFTRALTAAQVGVGGSVDWLLAR